MYGPQPSKKGRIPGPAGEGKGASRETMLKWGLMSRVRRASWMVWMVALEPEPWKARSVGLGVLGEEEEEVRGGVEGVRYVDG